MEKGEKVFEFTGYLNTLRLLIEKVKRAINRNNLFKCRFYSLINISPDARSV